MLWDMGKAALPTVISEKTEVLWGNKFKSCEQKNALNAPLRSLIHKKVFISILHFSIYEPIWKITANPPKPRIALNMGKGKPYETEYLQPVVTSSIDFIKSAECSLGAKISESAAIAEKVSTQPQTESIASLPTATEFTKIFFLFISSWVLCAGFSPSEKNRVQKPINNEDKTVEKYRIAPLLKFESIKVPTAVITKAGLGFTHQ